MKKGSVKEIAKIANVSIGTVDRVLHNRGRVSAKTREKILKIIRDLDYKPNIYARNLKLAKVFHFGVLMPELHQDSSYWSLPYQGMENAASELKSLNVRIHYFFFNKLKNSSFQSQCQKALAEKLDGLVIAPVLFDASIRAIQCLPKHLPYVFFDSFLPGFQPLSFIGQDSRQAGRLAGSLIQLLLPLGGEVLIIRNLPRDYHIDQRIQGFQEYISGMRHFRAIIYDFLAQEGQNNYRETVRKIENNHPDFQGLFIPHANTHSFVQHLSAPTEGKKMAVVGFDLIKENLGLLKKRKIDFLISQRPKEQGYQSIYSLYRHLILKEPIAETLLMPLEIINRENLQAT